MRFQQNFGSRIQSARGARVIAMSSHSNRASLLTHMRLEFSVSGEVALISVLVPSWGCC